MTTQLTPEQRSALFENRSAYLTELERTRAQAAEPVTEAKLTDKQREALFENRGQVADALGVFDPTPRAGFTKDFAEALMSDDALRKFEEALNRPKPTITQTPTPKPKARAKDCACLQIGYGGTCKECGTN